MDEQPQTLLDIYYDNDKEAIMLAIHEYFSKLDPIPLDDLLHILDDSDDIDIIGLTLELIYVNNELLFHPLVKAYKNSESEKTRFLILLVFCLRPTFQSMDFIIGEYLADESFRNHIRNTAFKDKHRLFTSLAKFVEENPLDEAETETVKDILATIPRQVIVETGGAFVQMKIYDLYYSIDPKLRAK